jgi:hypothetical protein
MIGGSVLIGAKARDVDCCGVVRHRSELVSRDEAPASTQRDQLADLVAIPGDRERLAAFNGIHDLFRPLPKVALRDLGLAHGVHLNVGVALRGTT